MITCDDYPGDSSSHYTNQVLPRDTPHPDAPILDGVISVICLYGVFVEIKDPEEEGFVTVEKIPGCQRGQVLSDIFEVGQAVKVQAIRRDRRGRLSLMGVEFPQKPAPKRGVWEFLSSWWLFGRS